MPDNGDARKKFRQGTDEKEKVKVKAKICSWILATALLT